MSEVDYEKVRAAVRASSRGAPGWPTGVRPISQAGLALLGIGPGNGLYWDGEPIKIDRELSLTLWQTILATATALGALAGGVAALLPYIGVRPG